MFWLVETSAQFENLKALNYKEAFVEIVLFNNTIHPCENDVCIIYYRPLSSTKGYVLPVFHSETLSLNIHDIKSYLSQHDKLYVRDKKEFLHYLILHNTIDITFYYPYTPESLQIYRTFYKQHSNHPSINSIIPIVKHYEYCEKIFLDLKNHIHDPINEFYNNRATVVFNALERSGLRIDRKKFEQNFYPPISDYVYTQYNFKTLTTRPSNHFGGVNYAALNKENGERESFIPRNDIFIELDISAYHPTILSKLVEYQFDNPDIYQALSEVYNTTRDEAKILTLQQMYGGILSRFENIEFFQKVNAYIDNLWDTFQYGGYVKCDISGYEFRKSKLEDMNPQKLLNYVIQNAETSININLLWEMFKILKGCNTKIVLYTYDSFLFDFDKTEKEQFKLILKLFETYGLNVKEKHGKTYNF